MADHETKLRLQKEMLRILCSALTHNPLQSSSHSLHKNVGSVNHRCRKALEAGWYIPEVGGEANVGRRGEASRTVMSTIRGISFCSFRTGAKNRQRRCALGDSKCAPGDSNCALDGS